MTRVYDFDNTIFDGDSTARFCAFSIKKRPGLLLKLPPVAAAFVMMSLGFRDKTWFKQRLFTALLRGYDGTRGDAELFWEKNFTRIKSWYIDMRQDDDIIISASPEFLLRIPCQRLGVRLIASRVDEATGEYTGLNCHGEEKARRYFEAGMPERFEFYSDSTTDAPMARKAVRAFMVAGDSISPWRFKGEGLR